MELFSSVICLLGVPYLRQRWFGESVREAIVHTDSFLTNARGYPCLSKRHQKLITGFLDHSIQIVISGKPIQRSNVIPAGHHSENNVDGLRRHLLKPFVEYVAFLSKNDLRELLQSPLHPHMDNLEAQTYDTFEKDTVKYSQGSKSTKLQEQLKLRKIKKYQKCFAKSRNS